MLCGGVEEILIDSVMKTDDTFKHFGELGNKMEILQRDINAMNVLSRRENEEINIRKNFNWSLFYEEGMTAGSTPFNRHSIWSFISNLNNYYSHNELFPSRKTTLQENRAAKSILRSVDELFRITSNTQFIHSIEHRYQFLNPIFGTIHMIAAVMRQGNDTLPGKQVITKNYFSKIELNEELDSLSNEGTHKAKSTVQRHENKTVHLITSLPSNFESFFRLMNNVENTFWKSHENVHLVLVMFLRKGIQGQDKEVKAIVTHLTRYYFRPQIRLVQISSDFKVQKITKLFSGGDLLFFVDNHSLFSQGILSSIRTSTVRGKQVYFPIGFHQHSTKNNSGLSQYNDPDGFDYWLGDGYRHCAVYKSDLDKIGNVDVTEGM